MNGIPLLIMVIGFVGAVGHASALEFQVERTADGKAYIIVSGEFLPSDDVSRLARVVEASGAKEVVFKSNGGTIYKAMELGRLIRRLNLGTIALRQMECVSACALTFLGGTTRYAEPSSIGVHRTSFDPAANVSAEDAVDAVQAMSAAVMSFVAEMGADPKLVQIAMSYKSDDMRYLSGAEMAELRVTRLPPHEGALEKPTRVQPNQIPQDDSPAVEKSEAPKLQPSAAQEGRWDYTDVVPPRRVKAQPIFTQATSI